METSLSLLYYKILQELLEVVRIGDRLDEGTPDFKSGWLSCAKEIQVRLQEVAGG